MIKDQHAYWLDTLKNSCQSCHALGSHGVRVIPDYFKKEAKTSVDQWTMRTQAGQAQANMALSLGRLGPDRAYKIFADLDRRLRIEKGAKLPAAKPQRPARCRAQCR